MGKMHADELEIDEALVRHLVATQFPHWAALPILRVPSAGTDNALFRFGIDKVVRLPHIHWAVDQVEREHRWLPALAPHLPFAIPQPLVMGKPAARYPWSWSVYRWLDGDAAIPEDLHTFALDLARFMQALQSIDTTDAPAPSTIARGVPLALRDEATRNAIQQVHGLFDTGELTAAWEAALDAPAWPHAPVWLHGDLRPGNFLFQGGRLSAVIDFGCMAVGDPACDLQAAWNLLDGTSRGVLRDALAVDDAAWARGKGWALSVGLIALPYYLHSNHELAGISRRAIQEVLADE
jgi:aminoglycoside phosphotransferase (APT) family kinase protein